jgi:hypothetical protein
MGLLEVLEEVLAVLLAAQHEVDLEEVRLEVDLAVLHVVPKVRAVARLVEPHAEEHAVVAVAERIR